MRDCCATSPITENASTVNAMASAGPGNKLAISYVDQYGTKHSTTVTLTEWAK